MNLLGRMLNKLRGNMDIDRLKSRGLTVGNDVFINFGCIIDETFCWLIQIGDRVTLGPRVHVLAHDASTKREMGLTKVGAVTIGDDVFIGAGSIILPGVTIGNKVVIGAGSVVSKSIPDNSVAAGVPAKVLGTYDDYFAKMSALRDQTVVYDRSYSMNFGAVSDDKKKQMRRELQERIGFVP